MSHKKKSGERYLGAGRYEKGPKRALTVVERAMSLSEKYHEEARRLFPMPEGMPPEIVEEFERRYDEERIQE